MYWNVLSVALRSVWISGTLFHAKRGPLKASVSKKTDDISNMNSIVTWNRLAKSTILLISCLLEVHIEKISSRNFF